MDKHKTIDFKAWILGNYSLWITLLNMVIKKKKVESWNDVNWLLQQNVPLINTLL